MEAIYGHNSPKSYGYDHYASELALLYIITVARLELEIFEEMSRREPTVGLDGWDEVRADIDMSTAVSSHLWFPSGSPHWYDRVQQANFRGMKKDLSLASRDERPKPEELTEAEILYYPDPLKRIVGLHSQQTELFGFEYISPWPRSDASPFRH